jgi:hypothetical protein
MTAGLRIDCPMRSSKRDTSLFTGPREEGQAPEINLSVCKRAHWHLAWLRDALPANGMRG